MITDASLEFVEDLIVSGKPFNERAWGLQLIYEIRRLHRESNKAQVYGIRMAAEIASAYDRTNTHPYLVSDCILSKLNVRRGSGAKKPRRNKSAKKVEIIISSIERKLENIDSMMRFLANHTVRLVVGRPDTTRMQAASAHKKAASAGKKSQ